MSKPYVTILTAVRNGAQHIASTIECALKQTFTDWEYIVVDDASTDETVRVVEEFSKRDPRIQILRRSTSDGPYIAANAGIAVARGKYIIRTDADDHFPPERIAKQLAFLEKNPNLRACVSYWQGFNDRGIIPRVVTAPANSRVFRWALLLRAPSLHSAVCYEKSAIEELGGYRELRLAQDYRLWCDLTRRAWLGTIPEVLCYVRYHQKRQTHTNAGIQVNLGLDVLADHLYELTGERWSREDITALRSVGLSERMPVARGLEMLDRWDRFWANATDLTEDDRRELAQMSAFRRWKHLRANARTEPAPALKGFLSLTFTHSRFLVPALREAR